MDAIEANDYNNFTQRAYVPRWRKLASLPMALAMAQIPGAQSWHLDYVKTKDARAAAAASILKD